MNMQFLLDATNGKIFKIMADVTSGLLSKRMDVVVPQGISSKHYYDKRRNKLTWQSVLDFLFSGQGAFRVQKRLY